MSVDTRTTIPISDAAAAVASVAPHPGGPRARPFQYSLWALMVAVTCLAVVLSAAKGGLGELVRDATRFFLLVFALASGAIAFLFAIIFLANLIARR